MNISKTQNANSHKTQPENFLPKTQPFSKIGIANQRSSNVPRSASQSCASFEKRAHNWINRQLNVIDCRCSCIGPLWRCERDGDTRPAARVRKGQTTGPWRGGETEGNSWARGGGALNSEPWANYPVVTKLHIYFFRNLLFYICIWFFFLGADSLCLFYCDFVFDVFFFVFLYFCVSDLWYRFYCDFIFRLIKSIFSNNKVRVFVQIYVNVL